MQDKYLQGLMKKTRLWAKNKANSNPIKAKTNPICSELVEPISLGKIKPDCVYSLLVKVS